MAQEVGWLIVLTVVPGNETRSTRQLKRSERRALKHLVEFGVDRLGIANNPTGTRLVLTVDVDPELIGEADGHRLPEIIGAVLRELSHQLRTTLKLEGPIKTDWHRYDQG